MTEHTFTPSELTFIKRMVPFVEKGMTVKEAAQAVIDRDAELFAMMLADNAQGEAIRNGLAAQTYHAIRGQQAVQRAVDDAADSAASGRRHWK